MSVTISGGGGVKSIQRGNLATTDQGATAILSPVNPDKCQVTLYEVSTAYLDVSLNASGLTVATALSKTIFWEVVEYA